MKNYVPCLICGHPVEREAQEASPFVREFQALKADQREVGVSTRQQYAQLLTNNGANGTCRLCGSAVDIVPVINGDGGWQCRGDCPTPERTFPILGPRWPGAPRTVPWAFMEPHRRQALKNHDQTLERLADRGGLDPGEMVAVVEERPWSTITQEGAIARLKELLAAWDAARTAEDGAR